VDGSVFVGFDGTSFIDGFANNINNSSESFWSDWHKNGVSGVCNWLSTNETFS